MKLSELLTESAIEVPLQVEDKWQSIGRLAQLMVEGGGLPESLLHSAEAALIAREETMTTGMEEGIAIPHAALDDLPEVVGVVGIVPEGVAFEARDGKPATIIVCLLIPKHRKIEHIPTLAAIAKLLSRAEVRERILACRDAGEVLHVILEEER